MHLATEKANTQMTNSSQQSCYYSTGKWTLSMTKRFHLNRTRTFSGVSIMLKVLGDLTLEL